MPPFILKVFHAFYDSSPIFAPKISITSEAQTPLGDVLDVLKPIAGAFE